MQGRHGALFYSAAESVAHDQGVSAAQGFYKRLEPAEKYDAKAGNKVRDLGVDYWNKIDDLRGIVHRESLISSLNDREYEVALLAADRLSSSEIAKQLYISESTVKFHLSNIFAKLGIKKKTEIAAALEKNLSHNFSLMKSRKEW